MTYPFTPTHLTLGRCACAIVATLALGSAAANNGIVTTTATEHIGPFYIPCLNEMFVSDTTAEVRTHLFQTPGGNTHLIDNWTVTTIITGVAFPYRQWAGTGVSPFHMNVRLDGGGGYGWTASRRLEPLDGGPTLVFTATVKFVKNALGEVVVDMAPVPGTSYNCLGPKG